jgi:hypothetical protein
MTKEECYERIITHEVWDRATLETIVSAIVDRYLRKHSVIGYVIRYQIDAPPTEPIYMRAIYRSVGYVMDELASMFGIVWTVEDDVLVVRYPHPMEEKV